MRIALCIQLLSLLAVQFLHFTDSKAIEVSSLEAREEDLADEAALDKRVIEDKDNQVETSAELEERGLGHEEYQFNNEVEVEMRDVSDDDLADFEEAAEEETEEKREDDMRFKLINRYGRTIRGSREGLLLFNGGTVCSDHFNDDAAHAICRSMGFGRAINFRSGLRYGRQQRKRNIEMDDVRCDGPWWRLCGSQIGHLHHDCNHHQDVFLTCRRRNGKAL